MDSWLGVEIRHLAALAAIHDERSFRGAADRLGYVQSAVSAQLSRLEELVGARLVDRARGHSRVELTAEGKLLLEHAERMLAQLHAAQADLEAQSGSVSGALRVGAFQSAATRIVPFAIARLASAVPGLRVITTETASDSDLFTGVERGELDVAFAQLPLEPGPFDTVELASDPVVLLVHEDSRLAWSAPPVSLREVVELPLIAHPAWRMMPLIDQHLRATGQKPDYRFQSDTNTAIHELVASGLGAAILPRLAVDDTHPGTAIVELDSALPSRTLVLYWHSERARQPALEDFVAATRAAIANAIPPLRVPASRQVALTAATA